jgi:hypothetical protein
MGDLFAIAEEGAQHHKVKAPPPPRKWRRITHLQLPECPECGALVSDQRTDKHLEWHETLAYILAKLRGGMDEDGSEDDNPGADYDSDGDDYESDGEPERFGRGLRARLERWDDKVFGYPHASRGRGR